ncbi:MAG: right-handed parallel beta-helix repeat-containing protein [Desulfobacteraceae bacterium]|nr:right-handed parallel beta-helix repeat-containing protein [Desulfobacteraceae bacterium]
MILRNRRIISSIFFACLLIGSYSTDLFAETHYVSPAGTATWNKSKDISTPCSAETALSNATAGDLVYFRGGTYNPGNAPSWETPAWNPSNSGSSGSPITFQCYVGETCTVLHNAVGPALGSNGRDYIVWDGFQGSKVGVHALAYFYHSDNCTVKNFEVKGLASGSSNNSCIGCNTTNYLTVQNCKVWNSKGSHQHNCCGMMFYEAHNLTVEYCTIYDCNTGIYDKSGGQHNTFRNNFIYDIINESGFRLESGAPFSNPVDISVYQNLLIDCALYSTAFEAQSGKTISDVEVYNNTFYQATASDYGVNTWSGGTISGFDFFNNIIYTQNQALYYHANVSNIYSDYNCFYGVDSYRRGSNTYNSLANWKDGTGLDDNSIKSDPVFVNAAGRQPGDYKLQTGSPCRGEGKDGKDMGAYPNGDDGTIIGYVGGGLPDVAAPPKNPRIQ